MKCSAQYSVFISIEESKAYWSQKKVRDKLQNTIWCRHFYSVKGIKTTIVNQMFLVTLIIYGSVTSH